MQHPGPPRQEIILIGPCGSGKSTLGRLLSEKLGIPNVSLDDLCQNYRAEVPDRENSPPGPLANFNYPKSYIENRWKDLHALKRMLSEHSNCVFDLGAGHSIYDYDDLLKQAGDLLAPYPNVVLLLPAPDQAESIRILRERTIQVKNWDCMFEGFDFHEHFVRHPSNRILAKHVVFTAGKTPEETRDEILRAIRKRARRPSKSKGAVGP